MVAEMPRGPEEGDEEEKEEEESGRIKRKVCEARNVSAAEAACLPQLLLALRPASETRVKDGDIASLCTRTPFPSFIYLCPLAMPTRLSTALFSGCSFRPLPLSLFRCRTVYVGTETNLRFEVPVLTCCHRCSRGGSTILRCLLMRIPFIRTRL